MMTGMRLLAAVLVAALAAGCSTILGTEASDTVSLEVAEGRVPCMGVGPMECLLVREAGRSEYQLFYDGIEGFVFEPGFRYRLTVSRHAVPNPPADASSVAHRLVRVDGKERSPRFALLAEMNDRRATWRAARPLRYRAVVARECFCVVEARGPVEVDVRVEPPAGMEWVEDRRYVGDGTRVASTMTQLFPGIDDLFGIITHAVANDAHNIEVEYHATLGYPTRVFIDRSAAIADEETGYRVLSVTAR